VNCDRAHPLLSPLADGELDLERAMEMESHLSACPACAQAFERINAIRTAAASPALYHRAPAALADRLRASIGAPAALADRLRASIGVPATAALPAPRHITFFRPLALAALLAIVCGLAAMIGVRWQRNAEAHSRLLADLVTAHVRSVQGDKLHLMDVLSTDQHTVKPWFIGKIDFVPDVPQLAPAGFPLAGGRLDYIDNHPAAALIYYSGQHVVNLFLWPSARASSPTAESLTAQSFHLRHWTYEGLDCWAITDAAPATLEKFEKAYTTR
jgi:anti-sigma factor RsiW